MIDKNSLKKLHLFIVGTYFKNCFADIEILIMTFADNPKVLITILLPKALKLDSFKRNTLYKPYLKFELNNVSIF